MLGLTIATMCAGWLAWSVAQRAHGQRTRLLGAINGQALEFTWDRNPWGWRAATGYAQHGHYLVTLQLDLERGEPRAQIQISLRPRLDYRLQIHVGPHHRWVLGDERTAAGLLGGRVRAALGAGDQLLVGEDNITLITTRIDSAEGALDALTELAERLKRDPSPEVLLLGTALEDDSPLARAEAASFVLDTHPELAEPLASDAAPEVRLAVARKIRGRLGFDLASEILTSEIFHGDVQQAALRFLLFSYPPQEVGTVLVGALGAADENLLGALIPALARTGHQKATRALHAALPTSELANAARIAEALTALQGCRAEPTLLELLKRLPTDGPALPDEEGLAAAIADGLGRVGTRLALPPLRQLALQVTPESDVGIAVKVALDLVRSREGAEAEPGALALVGSSPVEGRLSEPPIPKNPASPV